ncbi:unnamed protein product [Spirodela intermedia]|uniref:Core Histone H2A/H2B/H3 domain-containing protein n=1 Tax=Spirodela intermedia TaxID=51605 RepID=A0A7I8L9Y3_SPIIN|nr:unnamed protein product [Spirodela intermedia]
MKKQVLPLSRIKRLIKENQEIKRISAGTPLLFSKASELFIMEVTFRAWLHAEMSNRQSIEIIDIAGGISQVTTYSFLQNMIQRRCPIGM